MKEYPQNKVVLIILASCTKTATSDVGLVDFLRNSNKGFTFRYLDNGHATSDVDFPRDSKQGVNLG